MKTRPVEQAYMTDLLMELILTGHAVHAVPVNGGWLEIDTSEDFETATSMIEDGSIERFFNPLLPA
jgi:NDP-sugar pyrophosphorylase family protein